MSKIITGSEAVIMGALDAGARIMYGYPITPATEILEGWVRECQTNRNLVYLQTEDEISAGFNLAGSVIAGTISFTASAGPGHILLQDSFSMAENLRLPVVSIIMQRGGPSTGTVNYSQQEVNLACFGGNGDGHRIVYSASSIAELYELTYKSFEMAWKHRYPTTLLGDGYLAKMSGIVQINRQKSKVRLVSLLGTSRAEYLRNCYSDEKSFGEKLHESETYWKKYVLPIAESEKYFTQKSKIVIVSHGIVSSVVKEAITEKLYKYDVGLFRPITLNPFDDTGLRDACEKDQMVIVIESSKDQLLRLVKNSLSGMQNEIVSVSKPAQGFNTDEVINLISKYL
jgi:2-oxoglutarate/2-oxoacid ferredoxin oxidoreductase subunit alpha